MGRDEGWKARKERKKQGEKYRHPEKVTKNSKTRVWKKGIKEYK